mmetsp:Transcript_10698/g.23802  ORF Transcript_10698/g.23802 Transcript_10698/m.23802 type:complete len:229 (+) Transcript_10698:295-981(+)
MIRVASGPSMTGIWKSIKTISYSLASEASTANLPFSTASMCSIPILFKVRIKTFWLIILSSAIKTRSFDSDSSTTTVFFFGWAGFDGVQEGSFVEGCCVCSFRRGHFPESSDTVVSGALSFVGTKVPVALCGVLCPWWGEGVVTSLYLKPGVRITSSVGGVACRGLVDALFALSLQKDEELLLSSRVALIASSMLNAFQSDADSCRSIWAYRRLSCPLVIADASKSCS